MGHPLLASNVSCHIMQPKSMHASVNKMVKYSTICFNIYCMRLSL